QIQTAEWIPPIRSFHFRWLSLYTCAHKIYRLALFLLRGVRYIDIPEYAAIVLATALDTTSTPTSIVLLTAGPKSFTNQLPVLPSLTMGTSGLLSSSAIATLSSFNSSSGMPVLDSALINPSMSPPEFVTEPLPQLLAATII